MKKNPLNDDSQISNENPDVITGADIKKAGYKKALWVIVPILILIVSFIFGFIFFFNMDVLARYMIMKGGYPVDIDKLEMHLSGNFNIERLRYGFNNRQGVADQLKMEYISGSISTLDLALSKKLNMDIRMKGVKIPFESGMISGGSWKVTAIIRNVSKNVQQWDGDILLTAEDAMVQYSVMNSNYAAIVKSAKIKGHIKNSLLQLETSEILTDIAKITVSGNTTINYPYNVNIQLSMLPLDEFGRKYPDEKNMLSALLQKDPNIVINLSGTIDKLNPQIRNLAP